MAIAQPGVDLADIQESLNALKAEIEDMPTLPSDAMTYCELKMQLMVNYIANLSLYIGLKAKGETSIGSHPVFKHLAYLRTFMERLVPLDAALKYQIDKLLLEDTEATNTAEESAPNLAAFVPSVKAAVKSISVEQVKASLADSASGSLEIDPALIAAQIQKVQQKKTKRKVKTYVEKDSEDERVDEDVPVPKKTKKVIDEDDEEIESDFDLD
jgi:hypothetical protein